jgi:hypothetical protein
MDHAAEAASATLAYQFGWGPLIQDIGKMLDLADIVKKRQEQLKKAHSERGLRRKVNLDDHHASYNGNDPLSTTFGRIIRQPWTGTKTARTWGTVRWTVRDPSLYGKPPSFREAFDIALGLNAGYIPISIWKALPWSWAIDWFADISNIINANHNMVMYKPSKVCIMREFTSEWQYLPVGDPNGMWHILPGYVSASWKTRSVHNPTPTLNIRIPFLDSFKLSILGSFAILGLKGRG